MPAEIIEELLDSTECSLSLEMKASGLAILNLFKTTNTEDVTVNFLLTPDAEGLRLAEQIEQGLREWREQVGRITGES